MAVPPTYFGTADREEMRNLKELRSLLVEGVDSALQLNWSPNEVEFVDAITGSSERFRVFQMQVRPRCLKVMAEVQRIPPGYAELIAELKQRIYHGSKGTR